MAEISSEHKCRTPMEAALCCLRPEDGELLELLLDVLGWKIVKYSNIDSKSLKKKNVIFVEESWFFRNRGDFDLFECVCVICAGHAAEFENNSLNISVKINFINSPIDIEEVEKLLFNLPLA
ncbi:hypothetical protein [Umezakia ovalisporum]|uniref:hypothetical protein n=1 Tax=Umezakia ovalisporum TaxID=75695 RepID=UPI0039C63DF3